jgi:hypothetical protein
MTQRSVLSWRPQWLPTSASTIDTDSDTMTRRAHTDDGDHDKFAHYAKKNDITEAMVTGKAVTAICGKKWVPTRSPDDFPVCPDCKRIYDQLKPSG